MRRFVGVGLCALLAVSSCGQGAPESSSPGPYRLGVMLPLSGVDAEPAEEQLHGIELAIDHVNRHGGVHDRRVQLVVEDVHAIADAPGAAARLRSAGASVVLGTYASWLSIPASAAVARENLVYWETGAVADRITKDTSPLVFRVGAAGSTLGEKSATFVATVLAPKLHKRPEQIRSAIVEVSDDYGNSVADGVATHARKNGLGPLTRIRYRAGKPQWNRVFAAARAARPDVLFLASYVEDGVEFRRQMLRRGFRVDALIGTTMAQCGPDFGKWLGADAIGVFASDRPTDGFNPTALNSTGRASYDVMASRYQKRYGELPAEEALSGFTSAWALLMDVLPRADELTPESIAAAARQADVSTGSLPNGAGLKFGDDSGQNLRAASVIWQWQAVRKSVTVWPPVYATAKPKFVPLPR